MVQIGALDALAFYVPPWSWVAKKGSTQPIFFWIKCVCVSRSVYFIIYTCFCLYLIFLNWVWNHHFHGSYRPRVISVEFLGQGDTSGPKRSCKETAQGHFVAACFGTRSEIGTPRCLIYVICFTVHHRIHKSGRSSCTWFIYVYIYLVHPIPVHNMFQTIAIKDWSWPLWFISKNPCLVLLEDREVLFFAIWVHPTLGSQNLSDVKNHDEPVTNHHSWTVRLSQHHYQSYYHEYSRMFINHKSWTEST